MCNLTEVNANACASREEFLAAVEAATIIGTLQVFVYIHYYYYYYLETFVYHIGVIHEFSIYSTCVG
jgi:hypothetical protein